MSTEQSFYHESVLLQECIQHLNIIPNGIYVDATFGGGGHSRAILQQLGTDGRLIAFDQDKDAQRNLPQDPRLLFVPENFKYLSKFLRLYNIPKVNGILADLGVSSYQFDTAERGFSIRYDAALDMRMDARTTTTAADIINTYTEAQLHKLFEQYGEVTNARTLASTIVRNRASIQVNTINHFKQLIASCIRGVEVKYLAQVFQALRIQVNQELQVLQEFCTQATDALAPGGRLCVITFHSLEDRIVKQHMMGKHHQQATPYNPYAVQSTPKQLNLLGKPITAGSQELHRNARARSAKLRVAEKI
jgi:16S rRNA (cytosine1402-N4)-methyltransferase